MTFWCDSSRRRLLRECAQAQSSTQELAGSSPYASCQINQGDAHRKLRSDSGWVVGLENVRTNWINLQVERQIGLHCVRRHKDDVALTYLKNVAMPAKVQMGLNCLFFCNVSSYFAFQLLSIRLIHQQNIFTVSWGNPGSFQSTHLSGLSRLLWRSWNLSWNSDEFDCSFVPHFHLLFFI